MIKAKNRSLVHRFAFSLLAVLAVVAVVVNGTNRPVYAFGTLLNRTVEISDAYPDRTAEYTITMASPPVAALGSIKVEFCENSPLYTEPCDAPAGFSLSGAMLVGQSGDTGFIVDPASTPNVLILSRAPGASTGPNSAYVLQNVVNASAIGTQYARFSTYASSDASGAAQDTGAVAYVLNENLGVGTEVPPYLEFCLATTITGTDCNNLGGNYLDMGDFNASRATTGQLQMAVATNAANGYMVSLDGQTMASGNNALPALPVPTASGPGTNQFGINLRANSNPVSGSNPEGVGSGTPTAKYNIANRFAFQSGDVLASNPAPDDFRKFTVTYLVNISKTQPAGVYAGSYTYVGLGNF